MGAHNIFKYEAENEAGGRIMATGKAVKIVNEVAKVNHRLFTACAHNN